MNRLLPFGSTSRPAPEDGARIVGVDDPEADEVFAALSSDTTRAVLAAVYETPGTASEVAETVDTSLQNVTYHLSKLQDANLVEVADTWYSEQGTEMKVYAPTNESLVMLAGDEGTRWSIRETLSRLLGAVGVLGLLAILVESVVSTAPARQWNSSQPSPLPAWVSMVDSPVSPGLLFFLGGVAALLVLASWARLRARS